MELLIIILLVGASLAGLTFIIERGLALRWKKVVPPEVEEAVANCHDPADLPMLRRVCEQNPSALSRLLLLADKNRDWPREENVDGLQTRARYEVARLERGLVVLEIVVGIGPLLGLVGTIYGLITLFGSMGQTGLGDNNLLARGIALALNATLMGLLTAIPSLIAWSYYNKKVETLAVEMETLCDEFLRRQYRGERTEATPVSKN
jgi:biopolymer transport protein ExbB